MNKHIIKIIYMFLVISIIFSINICKATNDYSGDSREWSEEMNQQMGYVNTNNYKGLIGYIIDNFSKGYSINGSALVNCLNRHEIKTDTYANFIESCKQIKEDSDIYNNALEVYKGYGGTENDSDIDARLVLAYVISNNTGSVDKGYPIFPNITRQLEQDNKTTSSVKDPISNPDAYKPNGSTATPKTVGIGKKIVGIVQVFGTIVSVISLMIIGIKYMLGSIEEKAEYKQVLVPYLIGAVLLFATSNIVGIIYNFSIGLNS